MGWVALKRAVVCGVSGLLGAGVLGHGLGALRHGVLGQLSGEQQADGGLDLPGGDGGALVVVSQTGGLPGDALKDVAHEAVHDAHGLGGDAGVGVHLLHHFVHVDGVALLPGLSPLLAGLGGGLCDRFLGALFGRFHAGCFRHGVSFRGFNRKNASMLFQTSLYIHLMQIRLCCCSHMIGCRL